MKKKRTKRKRKKRGRRNNSGNFFRYLPLAGVFPFILVNNNTVYKIFYKGEQG